MADASQPQATNDVATTTKKKVKKGGKKLDGKFSKLGGVFANRNLETLNAIVGPSQADVSQYITNEKPRNIRLFADSITSTIENLYQNVLIPIDIIILILDYGVSEPSELWLYRQFRNRLSELSSSNNNNDASKENNNNNNNSNNENEIFDNLLKEKGYAWFDHQFKKGHTFSFLNRVANHRTKNYGGAISQICYADDTIKLSNYLNTNEVKNDDNNNDGNDNDSETKIESIKYETVYCVDIIVAEKSQEMWIGVTWDLENFMKSRLSQSRLHSYDTSVNNPHCILYYGGQEHKIHAEWSHFRWYFGINNNNNDNNKNSNGGGSNNNNNEENIFDDIDSKEIREEMMAILKETKRKNGANWNQIYSNSNVNNNDNNKDKNDKNVKKVSQRETFFNEMYEMEHRGFIDPKMLVKFVEWERNTKDSVSQRDNYKDGSLGTIFTLRDSVYKFDKSSNIASMINDNNNNDASSMIYELIKHNGSGPPGQAPDAPDAANENKDEKNDETENDNENENENEDTSEEQANNKNVNSFENTGVLTCEWYRSGDYITVQIDIETIVTEKNGIKKYAILIFKRNGRIQSRIRIKDQTLFCKENGKDCLQIVAMTCNKIDCLVFDRKK